MGMDQTTKQWKRIESYGGKFVENIVQAIARDVLAVSMARLDKAGYEIVLHVHDEVAVEIEDFNLSDNPDAGEVGNDHTLEDIEGIMGEPIPWAEGLPLRAEGYLSEYYKKD
jgi:DNA polymerase